MPDAELIRTIHTKFIVVLTKLNERGTRSITRELRRQNFSVGSTKVGVETHDFPRKELGKAVPYGVYDLQNNEGFVSVGNG